MLIQVQEMLTLLATIILFLEIAVTYLLEEMETQLKAQMMYH